MTTDESLSLAVITAVADRENVEPAALPDPLYNTIDPEALDRLFGQATGNVVFDYLGYQVTVASDGDVSVEG